MKWKWQLAGWKGIDTIPRDRAVTVLSVTGIVCRAKVQTDARVNDRRFPARIACFRRDGRSGDIMAIQWKADRR